ncbi:hypothetical protein K493DRAFT_408053 [Basidiobolus meristosporus CBS 931.73]|uniref:J domain-containing protein n=1 Tax=Basidiobolus meristosporus CBS 931.73 TaxID=1314790 RepID=A0A1Y1Y8E1_9FUNG|nr:hypothetical protein K493DRAFT_408053 [Basidiobolus meristosporus CBS 931.73]|eukprot:ORX94277.1 hypothetical protein K493DRAFT_408053 [Basidiobolus meristosporus CBS 931.73]
MPEQTEDLDLYEILQVGQEASLSEVKRAYYKLVLLHHPYKAREDESLRSNRLDGGGLPHGEHSGVLGEIQMHACLKWVFPPLRPSINPNPELRGSLREGSTEEYEDLITAYETHKGDMGLILSPVLLAEAEDEDRLREILHSAIKKGDVKAYKKFTKVDKKAKARRRQAAAKEAKELGIDKNGNRMNPLMDSPEAKYASKEIKGKKRKTLAKEPSEEFQALQEKHFARK